MSGHFDVVFQQFGQFGDALEKVFEMDSAFLVSVAKHQDFERLQRDAVAQRRQRLTQFESLDVTLLLPVKIEENVLCAWRIEEEDKDEDKEKEEEEEEKWNKNYFE